ncbi:MAG: beta-lactamase family protein [Oscillospiraceae bacterium]|nr:beta-lactamase family protein [Oscillospiraceae bacterium]
MRKLFKKITAALFAGITLFAAAAPAMAEEYGAEISEILPSGMTVDKFQSELQAIKRELTQDDAGYASAAIGVFKGGEVLYTEYFGEIDIKQHIPSDENSVYDWGSITKTLIWVSAMQLWEQGRLDLDRDVREYLPDGFFRHLSYDDPITMLNLMNHNAGWQETTLPMWATDENAVIPLGEALQAIEPAQIHRPGEVAAYSNYGAALAGYIIERITGQDFCDYVHENIFEPLGMEHTALNPTHSDNAWAYERRPKTKSYQISLGNAVDLGSKLDYVLIYPAGAAVGTLSDLMIYAQALVNDDAPLFQNKETQAFMFTGTDFYGESDVPICAHGFWYAEYGVRICGHNGATTAGQANMAFDLDSKTGLVIMVNEPNGNRFLNETPYLVFGDLSSEKYSSGTAQKSALGGYYLTARSTYRGLLKFITYITAMPGNNFGSVEDIGSDVYVIDYAGTKTLAGSKTYPDGSSGLQLTSSDMIRDDFYLVKLCLFALYLLTATAAVYLLLIAGKLKKHKRQEMYKTVSVMTAGQIARIVSVAALISAFVIFQTSAGGIPLAAAAVIGVLQMLCIAVCAVSAVSSVYFIAKSKKLTVRYILNMIGCIIPIISIVYFEMYRFWGI